MQRNRHVEPARVLVAVVYISQRESRLYFNSKKRSRQPHYYLCTHAQRRICLRTRGLDAHACAHFYPLNEHAYATEPKVARARADSLLIVISVTRLHEHTQSHHACMAFVLVAGRRIFV